MDQNMVDSIGLAEKNQAQLNYELRRKTFGLVEDNTIELTKENMKRIAVGMFSSEELREMAKEKRKVEREMEREKEKEKTADAVI